MFIHAFHIFTGVGSFQRIKWDREGTKEIVIYTSTDGVHYCGLHELYTKVMNVCMYSCHVYL